MSKEKNRLLVVNKGCIFSRIKIFFKTLFCKNKNEKVINKNKIEDIEISNSNFKRTSFLKDIKIQENKELKELLYLQELLRIGRIKEKDLSKKERMELEKLYNQQIYDLKQSINKYRNKKMSLKAKLVNNN